MGYAIRNTTGPYAGDVWQCHVPETRDEYEAFRLTLGDPDAFEVVELDDNGAVVEEAADARCAPENGPLSDWEHVGALSDPRAARNARRAAR